MTCSKCNEPLDEGAKFCQKCGTPVPQGAFCQKCGAAANPNDSFCLSCGAQLGNAIGSAPAAVVAPPYVKKAAKKRSPGKVVALVFIGIVAIAAAVLIPLLIGGGGDQNVLFYLKDNEINYTSLSSMENKELTSDLYEDKLSANEASSLSYFIALSEDGSTLFYPDKVTDYNNGITLYCRNLKSSDDPIKIDSDIRSYRVNQDASQVYYVKGTDRILYVHNLDDKSKIDEEVTRYYIDEAGSKVIYETSEGIIYSADSSNEYDEEKIDSDSSIVYVSDALDKVYYLKDGSFYVKKGSEDKEKIDSDVNNVLKVYETGEAYYLKSEENQSNLMDYVEDDMAGSDASMQMPTEPVYPSWNNYGTWDEYYAACDEYNEQYESYRQQYDLYQAKLTRDSLRDALANETTTQTNSILYYYNGSEKEVITDSYNSYKTIGTKSPVIIYSKYNKSDISKKKLSEITAAYEVSEFVDAAMYSSYDVYIAVKSAETAVEQESGMSFKVNDSGTVVYFIDDYSEEKGYGDLYQMLIEEGAVGKPSVYDEDVYSELWFFNESDSFIYFKDVKESVGEMYMNKNSIDDDVYIYRVGCPANTETLVYIVDYNKEKQYGTLRLYNGEKPVKIADDVYQNFYPMSDNRILYLLDYNLEKGKGDAYMYDGTDEKKKIDEDVATLIPILKWDYKVLYGW